METSQAAAINLTPLKEDETIHSLKSSLKTEVSADIPDIPHERQVTATQDFIAGGIAGSASVVLGHPLDTIKVRIQTSSSAKIGNLPSLFRGMAAPLSTAAVVNAVIFSSFGHSTRLWEESIGSQTKELELQKSIICGSFAGLSQSIVICPMEHLKCRLQVASGSSYSGPLHVMSDILATNGIRGLYRGWYSTLWREVPGFAFYFGFYDYMKNRINARLRKYDPNHDHHWMTSAVAGGISGSISWFLIYPMDIIKTKIQTAPLNSTDPKESKIWHVAREIVRRNGWRSLFDGVGVALLRAFPVNAIIFPVYELTLMKLTNCSLCSVMPGI